MKKKSFFQNLFLNCLNCIPYEAVTIINMRLFSVMFFLHSSEDMKLLCPNNGPAFSHVSVFFPILLEYTRMFRYNGSLKACP